MKIKAVLFVLFTTVMVASAGIAVADDAEERYNNVFGAGHASCATFLKESKESKEEYLVALAWIHGFVSAAGAYNEAYKEAYKDTQKSRGWNHIDHMNGTVLVIHAHCKDNPLDILANATRTAVDVLIFGANIDKN